MIGSLAGEYEKVETLTLLSELLASILAQLSGVCAERAVWLGFHNPPCIAHCKCHMFLHALSSLKCQAEVHSTRYHECTNQVVPRGLHDTWVRLLFVGYIKVGSIMLAVLEESDCV